MKGEITQEITVIKMIRFNEILYANSTSESSWIGCMGRSASGIKLSDTDCPQVGQNDASVGNLALQERQFSKVTKLEILVRFCQRGNI